MSAELVNIATVTGFGCSAERVGCALRPGHAATRLCPSNRVLIRHRTRPEKNGPHKGPISVYWRWSESWAEDALPPRCPAFLLIYSR